VVLRQGEVALGGGSGDLEPGGLVDGFEGLDHR